MIFMKNDKPYDLDSNGFYAIFPVPQTTCKYYVKQRFGKLIKDDYVVATGKDCAEFFENSNYCNDQVTIYEIKNIFGPLDKILGARIKLIEKH